MTTRRLKLSLALWRRRKTYRARRLAKARSGASAPRVHKWGRLLKHARYMVDRRERQLATRGASAIRIVGNTVTGGTARQRVVHAAHRAADLYATGRRPSFYSQAGSWDVGHGITGERHGCRSDCSQWVTAMFHSAGLADPNDQSYGGGYTGTLGAAGQYITRSALQPGDLVLYGSAPHHHVELYVGPGDTTIGHGSPPVDRGSITMMPEVHFCRPKGLT